jgi:hypothetical protein
MGAWAKVLLSPVLLDIQINPKWMFTQNDREVKIITN